MKRVGENERLLLALIKMETDPSLEPIREWLAESEADAKRLTVIENDDVRLRQAQGSAREISEINESIASAREILKRVRGR